MSLTEKTLDRRLDNALVNLRRADGFWSALKQGNLDVKEVIAGNSKLKTRLLVDAMGHLSPIVNQARKGTKPEAVCVVVGSCAEGYPGNETGDLIYSLFFPNKFYLL